MSDVGLYVPVCGVTGPQNRCHGHAQRSWVWGTPATRIFFTTTGVPGSDNRRPRSRYAPLHVRWCVWCGLGWCYAVWVALLCCKPFPCELVSPLGCFGCVFVVSTQHVACECASHGFDGPQCVFWVIVDETHRNSIRYTCSATKTMSHMAIPTLTHLCLSPCMHAHVGLNECFAHAKLNVRTCMIVGWNHTLAKLKIITALLSGLAISAVPKQALLHHTRGLHTRMCPTNTQSRSTQHRLITGR